jgi:hypothetical protein
MVYVPFLSLVRPRHTLLKRRLQVFLVFEILEGTANQFDSTLSLLLTLKRIPQTRP